MATPFRIVAAIVAWAGLALQYYLAIQGRSGGELVTASLNYLSYFTILSNLLIALCFTVPLLAPRSALGRFFDRPMVRGAALLYAGAAALAYYLLFRSLWALHGPQRVADILLHYVTPALFALDWLFFARKGGLRMPSVLAWLVPPLIFAGISLVRGHYTGVYSHPFIDVNVLGLQRVLLHMLGFLGLFLLGGLLIVAIDDWMGLWRKRSRARAARTAAG